MILKAFNISENFEELNKWLDFWRWKDRIIKEVLPDIGYLIEKDGVNLCAGWLYTTNSLVALVEPVVSNPFAEKKDRDEGLDFLIECLGQRALKEGKRIVMTTVNNPSLIKRLERLGYTETAKGLKQFVRTEWQSQAD